jgi:hypothetical protein
MTHDRPTDDTAPCVGCGMCCDGTLYWLAKVTPGEEEHIVAHGLILNTENPNTTYFNLPCHHESCGQCTIYQDRFDICRSFRCQLLRNYQANDLTLDEATEKVRTAKSLLSAVVADDQSSKSARLRRAQRDELSDFAAVPDPETRAARAGRMLRIIALDTYLDRWFRNPRAPDA